MGARYLIGYKKKNNNSNKIEQGKREREESVRRQRERLQGLYTQK